MAAAAAAEEEEEETDGGRRRRRRKGKSPTSAESSDDECVGGENVLARKVAKVEASNGASAGNGREGMGSRRGEREGE